MPYVNVKVIENVFSPEEKAEMIHGITEAVVAVEGEGVRNYTVVVLETLTSNALSLVNDDWVLAWNSIPGRTYRVQFKNDLTETAWSDLPGDVTATGTVSSKSDSIGAATQRFYQILLLP